MKKFLREPLLHFLVLGAGLFLIHGWLAANGTLAPQSIVVSKGEVEHLAAAFERLHGRPPTRPELDGLIAGAIREEVFYREALAQGLDRDDVVVRRRLTQKVEFLAQDLEPVPDPTDAQLADYLEKRPDKFRIEPRYSFQQVYLSPSRRGSQLDADTARLLDDLKRAGNGVAIRGDTLMLDHRFDSIEEGEVRRLFGTVFAMALETLPTGTWSGPVSSGYGVHLVRLERRDAASIPSLSKVRDQVRREWTYEQQQAANARYYDLLRQRYEITIEKPDLAWSGSALATEARP